MRELKYIDAMREAVRQEMQRDPRVFVMGEDVQVGTFALTAHLGKEFGPERIRNTPISEGTTVGLGVGAAAAGMRPIVEMSMASFAFLGFDQFVNNASMLRYLSDGQADVPIVFHLRYGAKGAMGAQHSHSIHSMLMNVPGLKIVMPTTPYDAKGMMAAAIHDNNPVLLFAHGALSGLVGQVPEEPYTVPFGKARLVREGADITVVATGALVRQAEKAADEYAAYDIGVEVIDVRSLVPMDKQTILGSVAKTGRLVVADETHQTCGAAAEIGMLVAEEGFASLKAPIRRVCTPDVPIPFSPSLENFVLPDSKKISKAIESLLE